MRGGRWCVAALLAPASAAALGTPSDFSCISPVSATTIIALTAAAVSRQPLTVVPLEEFELDPAALPLLEPPPLEPPLPKQPVRHGLQLAWARCACCCCWPLIALSCWRFAGGSWLRAFEWSSGERQQHLNERRAFWL